MFDVEDLKLNNHSSDKKNLYTYYSAKKLHLSYKSSKYLLLEKVEPKEIESISLTTRNTMVISKENGILLFPRNF